MFQGLQQKGKMETLDTQNLTLLLAYQHVKSRRMKKLQNQIYRLGVSAGIDLESVDCDITVEEVIEANSKAAGKNCEEKIITQSVELQTKNLVYSYLRRNGYDVAEEFARIFNLQQNIVNLSTDLETIFQSKGIHLIPQTDSKMKRKTPIRRGLTAGIEFCDSNSVKFSNANSQGGGIIMTYKGMQYCFKTYLTNKDVSSWQCRRHGKLKCNGFVHYSSEKRRVVKERPHNDEDHTGRLIPSTMGTDDSSITYSKTLRKKPVMHFRGYEYTIDRRKVDGSMRWQCRDHFRKKCKGYLYTKNGHIDGQVQEHSHLPSDLPPVEKPKSDRMISSLF